MAEFLLDDIPHHHKILRSSDCLNLRLPNHLQCKTCTAFFNNLVFKPKQKRGTSANRICERPWHFSNSTSRMNVKRLSYQGVIAFLSKEGINDETSDEATDTEEEATTTTTAQKKKTTTTSLWLQSTMKTKWNQHN
jgi:hypothetical protein